MNKKLKESESFMEVDLGRPFEPDNTYYIINMFIVDKEGMGPFNIGALAGFNDQITQSKLAIVAANDLKNVCYSLEN